MGGAPVPAPPAVPARFGRLTAADCEVIGLDAGETVACGSADPIFVQAAGGRQLTGGEALAVLVVGPSGAAAAVPVALADGGGHFQATLPWVRTLRGLCRDCARRICLCTRLARTGLAALPWLQAYSRHGQQAPDAERSQVISLCQVLDQLQHPGSEECQEGIKKAWELGSKLTIRLEVHLGHSARHGAVGCNCVLPRGKGGAEGA